MLYILSGPDDFSINRELNNIKSTAGDPTMLSTNTNVFDGGQVTLDELRLACETMPFLSDKRLAIVYGLLERYAIKTFSSRPAGTKKTESQSTSYESFTELIKRIPETTVLVLIDSDVKENNPLMKAISHNASVKTFPWLKSDDLRHWIGQRVSDEGGSIALPAVNLLARIIGSNLWIMSNELNKLVSYADGRRIEEKDVKALVSYTQQASVFAMVDAIIEFNLQRAETVLQQLLKEGESPSGLLAMLNRQMRLIVRMRELKAQKLPENEMKSRLGITHDFIVRKTLEQAQRYTLPRLRQVYQFLLETDMAIKTGKYDGELALNILIAELCQQEKAPSSQPKHVQGITA